MSIKNFDVGLMACEDVQAWVKSAKFGALDGTTFVAADVDDGAFVVLGDNCADDVYTGLTDYNCYQAYAPNGITTLTVDDIYVIDIAGVSEGTIDGNVYKIGNKLVNLKGKAGYAQRVRAVKKGDTFWIAAGNFAAAVGANKYATLTEGATTLTPAAAPAEAGVNFKIVTSKPLTTGTRVADTEYLVKVL